MADAIGGAADAAPRVGIVLGSGLAALEERVEGGRTISFDEAGLPSAAVAGHGGHFRVGSLSGVPVVVQAGRIHPYEGADPVVVAAPVRAMAALGVRALVMTSAVGSLRPGIEPGSLVLLDDVLNLSFRTPLAGRFSSGDTVPAEAPFPDMSAPFDPDLQALALTCAREVGVELPRAVYAAVLGPAYETRAEVRMLGRLGGDVVGMSTVSEAVVAAAARLPLVAVSVVTNWGTGLGGERLDHDDVLTRGRRSAEACVALVEALVRRIDAQEGGA